MAAGKDKSGVEEIIEQEQEVVDSPSTSDEDNTPLKDLFDGDDGDDGPEEERPRLGRKKKNSEERMFVFTLDEEDEIVDWWRSHPILYNPRHPEFVDKGKKIRIIAKKAKEFGCTGK